MSWASRVAAAATLLAVGCSAAGPIGVQINKATGAFNVTVGADAYLFGLPPFFHEAGTLMTPSNGSLKIQSVSAGNAGMDGFGAFTSTTFTWVSSLGTLFETSFRLYDTAIVFSQTYVDGANGTACSSDVTSAFPSFLAGNAPEPLGVCVFDGAMTGSSQTYGTWGNVDIPGGIQNTGPVVLFNSDLTTSFVISAASNFMAVNQHYSTSTHTFSLGVMNTATSVPAGYTVETIVELGSGFNSVMQQWGAHMLARYGKSRTAYKTSDLTTRYLGYSTDNGAYYYYNTENNETYETTLLGVSEYATQNAIPYKWILLDSWWYPKGPEGGVTTWEAMPTIFPHGLDAFFNATGWSIQGHNRYWSNETTYAKQNGGPYDFVFNPDATTSYGHLGLPTQQEFWDFLMQTSKQWGLAVYEQDWLLTQSDDNAWIQTDVQLGRTWLMQMGRAADKYGLTIQYCMSFSRHVLQSLEIPSVTQSRASGDYHPGANQWSLGVSSIFAYAVGIAPTKDNYWTTPVQPGNPYGPTATEPFNRLQAVASIMSSGPVAISDKIGYSNVPLIMMSCMADGTLLQHPVPAVNTDATFLQRTGLGSGPNGELITSSSTIGGQTYMSVFAAVMASSYEWTAAALGYSASTSVTIIEANSTTAVNVLAPGQIATAKQCGKSDFQLYSLSPVLPNGWAVIGETAKWIPVNVVRFSDVSYTPSSVSVTLRGVQNEAIEVSFYNSVAKSTVVVKCVFGEEGTLVATVPAATCVAP